tara:strand:+ start:108 stop:320 length:213 start_codon:yes stop_codon:yes gene_type:complete
MKEPTNLSWRKQSKRFPYGENVLEDKKYLKDRTELFLKHGNGWWWFPSVKNDKKEYPNLKQYKKPDKKEK